MNLALMQKKEKFIAQGYQAKPCTKSWSAEKWAHDSNDN